MFLVTVLFFSRILLTSFVLFYHLWVFPPIKSFTDSFNVSFTVFSHNSFCNLCLSVYKSVVNCYVNNVIVYVFLYEIVPVHDRQTLNLQVSLDEEYVESTVVFDVDFVEIMCQIFVIYNTNSQVLVHLFVDKHANDVRQNFNVRNSYIVVKVYYLQRVVSHLLRLNPPLLIYRHLSQGQEFSTSSEPNLG